MTDDELGRVATRSSLCAVSNNDKKAIATRDDGVPVVVHACSGFTSVEGMNL